MADDVIEHTKIEKLLVEDVDMIEQGEEAVGRGCR